MSSQTGGNAAPSDRSDQQGVDRTREFLRLFGEHDRAMYAYILALVPNVAEVQDIAQEVRLRLWEQFDAYQPDTNFGAWSRTIAHYLILAHRKKSARQYSKLGDAFLESIAAEVSETVDELPRRQVALRECLKKLDDPTRKLLLRYYSGEQTAQQLGQELGRTGAAVRQSICRARRQLAHCIEAETDREAQS